MEITTKQEQRILQATEDFSRAMEIRNAMSLRVAMRVTAILRIGMVSLGIVTLILLLMLYAFTSKMDAMIDALATMNVEFLSMSENMSVIRGTLADMEKNISHVPAITLATGDITDSVDGMRVEVANMNQNIGSLNQQVHGVTGQVDNMTWQMRGLEPAVQHMGHDVNRMSGPMRMFNMFNPMD